MNLDRILPVVAPVLFPLIRGGQRRRQAEFDATPPAPGQVVFFGDSMTEWGRWDVLFPDLPMLNRGIGGYAVRDLLAHLEASIQAPSAVSLMIGTNDLHGGGRSAKVEDIAAQTGELVRRIRARAPDAPLFLTGVTPRRTDFRDRILRLNDLYRQIAADSGSTYVDVWPVLADADGAILSQMTRDGLHLSPAGYEAWADVLRPHLARFATPAG